MKVLENIPVGTRVRVITCSTNYDLHEAEGIVVITEFGDKMVDLGKGYGFCSPSKIKILDEVKEPSNVSFSLKVSFNKEELSLLREAVDFYQLELHSKATLYMMLKEKLTG